MLLILFAGMLPAGGMSNPFVFGTEPFWQHLGDIATHMILPAATLMLTAYGSYTLVIRSALLETLGEDYVLTARAKGLPQRHILWRHAMRNAHAPAGHARRAVPRPDRRRRAADRGDLLAGPASGWPCTPRSGSATTRCCRAGSSS